MFTTHKIQGAGGAGGADSYWLTTVAKAGVSVVPQGMGPDSNNNIYAHGNWGSPNNSGFLIKFNKDGTVDWNKKLSSTGSTQFRSMSYDSTGSIWIGGVDSPTSSNRGLLLNYLSDGTLQSQKVYGPTGNYNYFNSMTHDSSDNIIVGGTMTRAGATGFTYSAGIVKFSSSGVIQWQKSVYDSSYNGGGITSVDSSDNVYLTVDGNNGDKIYVVKFNSSGSTTWVRRLSMGSTTISKGSAVDSLDNLYVSFTTSSFGTGTIACVAKLNSAGTVQWCRSLGSYEEGLYSDSLLVDSNDDVYLTFRNDTGADPDIIIAKYNSSGSLQWQRSLRSSSDDYPQNGYTGLDQNDNPLISFYSKALSSDWSGVFAKLPPDGSGTGTYGSFTYAATSFTSTSRSISSSSHSTTIANYSNSIATLSATESSDTFTENTYEITP